MKAIKRAFWLRSFGALHRMKNNVLLLRNSGVSDVKIRKLVMMYPHYLSQKPEWIKDLLNRVEKDFRILLHSRMFPYGFHALAALSITDTKFMECFVLPYKHQKPDLYEQLKKMLAP